MIRLTELFEPLPEKNRRPLLEQISKSLAREETLHVNFICTHNSRRSHFSELLFRTACKHYGLTNVYTYSGGTEATSIFSVVAESCCRHGFTAIDSNGHGQRAWKIFRPELEDEAATPLLFSKVYHHDVNPKEGYHAIMVCDGANEACPVVLGARQRHPLQFVDPKHSDGTDAQAAVYDRTLRIIAREMGYIVRKIQAFKAATSL